MVADGESRGNACGGKAICKYFSKLIQIGTVILVAAPVSRVAAKDHHLGGRTQSEDAIHNGGQDGRVDEIVVGIAPGVCHPSETLRLVGMCWNHPVGDRKSN